MKVFYSKYELKPQAFEAKHLGHEGILLAFEESNKISYSLYQPIESLGDKSIQNFIKNFEALVLNKGSMKRVFELSINEESAEPLSVACYEPCRSVDEAEASASDLVKLKVKSLKDTIDDLNPDSKKQYILDANAQWSLKDLKKLEDSGLSRIIKYIEDPVTESTVKSSLPVASDFVDYMNYNYRVIKPTGFNHSLENKLNAPLVVTSYLDHPVGQIIAAQFAKSKSVSESCGLMSHKIFEPTDYSSLLPQGGFFKFSNYSDLFSLLKKENWRRLL